MKKGFSQEALKLIACVTMLIDHFGYEIIYPLYRSVVRPELVSQLRLFYYLCRSVGRIAFPIYAFLLAEGIRRTKDRKRYGTRLLISALLAEIPYDLMVSGGISGKYQSIMVTLLLGFFALLAMEKCKDVAWKPVAAIPFAFMAELLNADYGWMGVAAVALFELSRYTSGKTLVRFFGMLVLFHLKGGFLIQVGNFAIPLQTLGALSMLFIGAYDGRKLTNSKAVQWGFYLFYPAHILLLWLGGLLLFKVIL